MKKRDVFVSILILLTLMSMPVYADSADVSDEAASQDALTSQFGLILADDDSFSSLTLTALLLLLAWLFVNPYLSNIPPEAKVEWAVANDDLPDQL